MRTRLSLLLATLCTIAAGAAHAQSATYQIDPRHTFVTFEIGHRVGNLDLSTNRGRWDKKEGTVQYDAAGKTGKVQLTIDMASINTGSRIDLPALRQRGSTPTRRSKLCGGSDHVGTSEQHRRKHPLFVWPVE